MDKRKAIDTTLLDWVKEAAATMESGERLRILEIGCGEGARLEALSEYGTVVGVDDDEEAVRVACANCPSVDVQQVDYCNLPFEEQFDLVFSEDAFSMLADQIGLLKSVSRALAIGGKLVVKMGADGNIARVQEGLAASLAKHSGGYSCQFCFPKESAYTRVLDIAGFSVVDMQTTDCMVALPGGDDGLRLYAEQRFGGALAVYRSDDRDIVLDDFEDACREALWDADANTWMADVRTLRFLAEKQRATAGLGGSSQFTVLGA